MRHRSFIVLFFPCLVGCEFADDDAAAQTTSGAQPGDSDADPADEALAAAVEPALSTKPPEALIVSSWSRWAYLYQGEPTCLVPDDAWRDIDFDDDLWARADGELGYGDGDEFAIPYGPSAANKCITQYFRHEFTLPAGERDLYSSLTIRLLRDDGAAVYLNGELVVRSNLPDEFGPTTPASSDTEWEDRFFQYPEIANLLVDGPNVLAVEVHQRSKSSADLSFDLELVGVLAPGGPTRKTVRIASQEATIGESRPNTALGSGSRCRIEGVHDEAMMCLAKWDLASIPPGATIRAAHLDTIVTDASSDRYRLYVIDPHITWDEFLVTWNDPNGAAAGDWPHDTRPDLGFVSLAGVFNALSTGTRLIPLPPSVIAGWLQAPGSNQGLLMGLRNLGNTNELAFSASGEGLALVVTYDQ